MSVPIELEIFMRDLTQAGLRSVGKNVEGVEGQTRLLIAALEQVCAEQLKQLQANKQAGQGYTTQAANVQALTGQINGLKAGLKELQQEQARVAATPIDIDTDAVARKTNNLKMQFAQVARELPSLAMGPQMFILAISNNLPMLADAIADVRKQNELLAASRQKGVSVWRQLGKALLSPQTALVALISLGIVYGKDIAEWTKRTFGFAKSFDTLADSQKRYTDALAKGDAEAQNGITRLRVLYGAAIDASKSTDTRRRAINTLKKEYPDYFSKLSNEEIMLGKAAKAYDRLTSSFLKSSRARASMKFLDENNAKIIELEGKINAEYAKRNDLEKELEERIAAVNRIDKKANLDQYFGASMMVGATSGRIDELDRVIAGYRHQIFQLQKHNRDIEQGIDVAALVTDVSGNSNDDGGGNSNDDGGGSTTTGKAKPQDYASELAAARLRAEQETERLRIQIQQEGYARRRALARQEYTQTLADIDRQEKETLARMNEARQDGAVIPQSQYDAVAEQAGRQRVVAQEVLNLRLQAIDKEYREQTEQSLIDYYKEYGTYQEKRLATARDYARKIAAAETEGEKKTLARQRDDALAVLDFDQFKAGMDWEKVFGDLDRLSARTLGQLREQLKAYIDGIGEGISPESLDEVMEAFQALDAELADRAPLDAFKQSYTDLVGAFKEVRTAQSQLAQAQRDGYVWIDEYDVKTGELTRRLITQAEAEERLRNAQDRRYDAQKSLTQAVNSIGQKGQAIVQAGNDLVDTLSTLGIRMPEAVQGALEGVGTITSSLASIDLTDPFSIVTGATGVLKGLSQTVSSLFGNGKDTARYEALKEQLEGINEIYGRILAKEKESITFGGGFASIEAAGEAMKALNAQLDNYRRLAEAAGNAGGGWFEHGYAYKTNKAIGREGYGQMSRLLGKSIDDLSDLYSLSGNELYTVMSRLPDLWGKINENVRQHLEDIIDLKDEAKELQDALDEAMTGLSADSFYNDFISKTADISMSWEDMCDNFEDRLRESILAGLVSSQYSQRIKDLYNRWSQYAQSDGRITEQEAERLRDEYRQIVQDLTKQRDEMADAFGWETEEGGSSQEPSSGALTTMSQDSINRFEGIGRAMQTHLAGIDKAVADIRDSMAVSGETLATIATHTAYLVQIYDLLETMNNNGIKIQ